MTRAVPTHSSPNAAGAASRRGGFALVLSLILVTVVSGLCIGFVRLAAATSKAQTGSVDQMRAFYLAEAGLSEAFHAVRMGRSGRIASPTDGAAYGDGLLWVESAQTPDRKVWLRATAVVGGGRAILGLVVDPQDPPLGFFAHEDLVIESTVLADGFDSTERSYEAEVAVIEGQTEQRLVDVVNPFEQGDSVYGSAQASANHFSSLLTLTDFLSVLRNQVVLDRSGDDDDKAAEWLLTCTPIDVSTILDPGELNRFLNDLTAMKEADLACALQLRDAAIEEPDVQLDLELLNSKGDPTIDVYGGELQRTQVISETSDGLGSPAPAPDGGVLDSRQTAGAVDVDPVTIATGGGHTLSGGSLGSNGDVTFLGSANETSSVFGSVTPGIEGQIVGGDSAHVTGATDPRALEVELRPVVIPELGDSIDVVHSGVIAHVIVPGDQSIGTLTAEAGSEVIVRGPARIVVHDLTLEGGSALVLDTRDGDVELFVTGSVDMDPASFVETTGASAREVSIQAGAAVPGDLAPSLALDAQSQFRGTIYAPDSTVHIGGSFEVFGSVTARRLEVGAGARLHFDDESYSGVIAIPEQDSWQILDLPPSAERPSRFAVAAPGQPGGDPAAEHVPLAYAHRLGDVAISIRYIDTNGEEQRFAGSEEDFDWSAVASIEAQDRKAVRTEIVESGGETELADPDSAGDDWAWDADFQDQVEDVADWFAESEGGDVDPGAPVDPVALTEKEAKELAKAADKALKDAEKALKDAEKAVDDVIKAQKKVADAEEKLANAVGKEAKDIAKAEEKVAKEEEKLAQKVAEAAFLTVQEAEAALADAEAKSAEADAAEAKAKADAKAAEGK